jgi:hypothetical protein
MPVENRKSVVLAPGHGRSYPMGRLSAVFKADGAETAGAYSISEWWLEPHTQGPGAHSHPEDEPHMPAIAECFHAHPPGPAGE